MIDLNYRDARPIYEQIRDELRRLVLSGAMAEGDRLPSVRELAAELSINPNTIQRAYRELEADGCIISIAGKGSFVAGGEAAGIRRRMELMEEFKKMLAELRDIGMDKEKLLETIDAVFGEAKK